MQTNHLSQDTSSIYEHYCLLTPAMPLQQRDAFNWAEVGWDHGTLTSMEGLAAACAEEQPSMPAFHHGHLPRM